MSNFLSLLVTFALPILLAGALALVLTLKGRTALAVVLALALTGVSATLLLMAGGERLSMWEGMGAVFFGMIVLGPPTLGLWLGVLTGWLVRRARARRLGKDAGGR